MAIMLSEAYAIHEARLREGFTDYGEIFRDRVALAALISASDYVQALRCRRELAAEFATAMANLDIVITAATPNEAPAIDAIPKFAIFERPSLTMPFNVTGMPAMSVCCGYTSAGLPLAFQLAGKPFDEATVLRIAHAYEKATPWRSRRPQLTP
jgi:aspartyl-tRNA(Asn)/glutamyl-tRNA(Gln) amidotransferase subunit A